MKHKLLAAALAVALAGTAHADDAALKNEVATLRAELAALKAEVAAMRGNTPAPAAAAAANTSRTPTPDPTPVARSNSYTEHSGESATTLTGYGELNYNHPFGDAGASQADLRRAVLGFTHRIDDTTRVIGEFEWEHAV